VPSKARPSIIKGTTDMQIEERDYSEAKLRALAVIKDAVNDAFESRLWGAVAEIIYDDSRVQELLAEDPAVMRFLITNRMQTILGFVARIVVDAN
jgi:hypothetical protein